MEQNKRNIDSSPGTYQLRQQIVDHTYGIIKRQWGFSYIITKRGMKRASADVGLMFTALNLRRLLNINDKNRFKEFLQELALPWLALPDVISQLAASITPLFFAPTFYRYKKMIAAKSF